MTATPERPAGVVPGVRCPRRAPLDRKVVGTVSCPERSAGRDLSERSGEKKATDDETDGADGECDATDEGEAAADSMQEDPVFGAGGQGGSRRTRRQQAETDMNVQMAAIIKMVEDVKTQMAGRANVPAEPKKKKKKRKAKGASAGEPQAVATIRQMLRMYDEGDRTLSFEERAGKIQDGLDTVRAKQGATQANATTTAMGNGKGGASQNQGPKVWAGGWTDGCKIQAATTTSLDGANSPSKFRGPTIYPGSWQDCPGIAPSLPVVAGMSQWCPIIRPIFASGVPKPFQDCRRAAEMVSLGHTKIDTGRPPQACAETVPSLYWDRSGIAHGRPRVSPMPVQGLLMAMPSLFRYWVRFVRCRHTIHFGTPRGCPLIVQRCLRMTASSDL